MNGVETCYLKCNCIIKLLCLTEMCNIYETEKHIGMTNVKKRDYMCLLVCMRLHSNKIILKYIFFSLLLVCVSYTKYLKKSDNVKLQAHVNMQCNEYYCRIRKLSDLTLLSSHNSQKLTQTERLHSTSK